MKEKYIKSPLNYVGGKYKLLKDITFKCCSFEEYKDIEGYVIYCDPPYAGTTPYKQPEFPYEKFYDWCRKIGEKNIVLISEYSMPDDFECIWQKEMMCTLDSNRKENDKKNIRVEKLFRYKM